MKKNLFSYFNNIFFIICLYLPKILKVQNIEINEIEKDNSLSETSNNLIKNLRYNVNFENNSSYSITAEESELIDENNIEIILMKNVIAIFTSQTIKF